MSLDLLDIIIFLPPAVKCPGVSVAFGSVSYTPATGTHSLGDTLTATCDQGYLNDGQREVTSTCGADKQWSPIPAACQGRS